jgi:hypothetical protein
MGNAKQIPIKSYELNSNILDRQHLGGRTRLYEGRGRWGKLADTDTKTNRVKWIMGSI